MADVEIVVGANTKSGTDELENVSNALRDVGDSAAETESGIDKLKGGMAALGALAAAVAGSQLVSWVQEASAAAVETQSWATKLGTAVEKMSALEHAAASSGIEADTFRDGLATLSEYMAEFDKLGSGEALDALPMVGIALDDVAARGGDTIDMLYRLADAFKSSTDEQSKIFAANALLGDGNAFIDLLNRGSDGIKQLEDAAKSAGLVLSRDQVKAAQVVTENMSALGDRVEGLKTQFALGLAPALSAVVGWLASAAGAAEPLGDALSYIGDSAKFVGELIGNTTAALAEGASVTDAAAAASASYGERLRTTTNDLLEITVNTGEYADAADAAAKRQEQLSKDIAKVGAAIKKTGDGTAEALAVFDQFIKATNQKFSTSGVIDIAAAVQRVAQQSAYGSDEVKSLDESLSKLDSDALNGLAEAAQSVMGSLNDEAARKNMMGLGEVLDSVVRTALNKLGADAEQALGGVSNGVEDAITNIETLATVATVTGDTLVQAIGSALSGTKTQEDIDALKGSIKALSDSGKLTGAELQNALAAVADAQSSLNSTIDSATIAYEKLGIDAPKQLETVAASARASLSALDASKASTDSLREAFLVYAEAELAAADASGRSADAALDQRAAQLGLTAALGDLRDGIAGANAEYAALSASFDESAEDLAAAAEHSQALADAQLQAADTALALAEANGDYTGVLAALAQQQQAQTDAASMALQVARDELALADERIAALSALKDAGQELSAEQERQLEQLMRERDLKAIAVESAVQHAQALEAEATSVSAIADALEQAAAAAADSVQSSVDLADARVASVQAALDAAVASGNEAEAAKLSAELKQLEIDASKRLLEQKQLELEASAVALEQKRAEAEADGILSENEQRAIESAQQIIQAKREQVDAQQYAVEALEAEADAQSNLAQQTEESTAASDEQRSSNTVLAKSWWELSAAGEAYYNSQLANLRLHGDSAGSIRAFNSVVRETQETLNRAAEQETALSDAVANLRSGMDSGALSAAEAAAQLRGITLQASAMGSAMTTAGETAVAELQRMHAEASALLDSIEERTTTLQERLLRARGLEDDANRMKLQNDYIAEQRQLIDELNSAKMIGDRESIAAAERNLDLLQQINAAERASLESEIRARRREQSQPSSSQSGGIVTEKRPVILQLDGRTVAQSSVDMLATDAARANTWP